MNDRHPSGTMTTPAPASDAEPAHQASYGSPEAQYGDFTTYHGYDSGTYDTGAHATGHFTADPLFGDMPGEAAPAGVYDATQWSTGSHQILNHDPYAAQHHAAYDTGAYDTTAWSTDQQQLPGIPPQATAADGGWASPLAESDTGTWRAPDDTGAPADPTQQWEWGTQTFDTGAYDATRWNSDGGEATENGDEYGQPGEAASDQQAEIPFDQQATATFEQVGRDDSGP
ncbi:M23 family peptidase, partial [Streptomyces sp. NPDC057052]